MTGTGSLGSVWTRGRLDGVVRRKVSFHPDDRGEFGELWRATWTETLDDPPVRMVQANLSRSSPRVLRGLHAHRRQADLWLVVEGHPFIGLVDLRPAIRGEGPVVTETIDATPGEAVYLPAGVAHGFYSPDALTLVYLVSNEYDGTDELGFAWDDPEAAIAWPDPAPLVSLRDAQAPSMRALVDRFRAGT